MVTPQLPPSQRTTYQFPVYRWIGWLAVAGFAIGLAIMFFISGMFGIPAPLGWAFLVIIFSLGTLLLDRPKLLLLLMLFFFMLMPKSRILGLLAIPLPSFLDELFADVPLKEVPCHPSHRRSFCQLVTLLQRFTLLCKS